MDLTAKPRRSPFNMGVEMFQNHAVSEWTLYLNYGGWRSGIPFILRSVCRRKPAFFGGHLSIMKRVWMTFFLGTSYNTLILEQEMLSPTILFCSSFSGILGVHIVVLANINHSKGIANIYGVPLRSTSTKYLCTESENPGSSPVSCRRPCEPRRDTAYILPSQSALVTVSQQSCEGLPVPTAPMLRCS